MTDKSASSGNTDQGSQNNGQGADTGNRSLSALLDEWDKGSGADEGNKGNAGKDNPLLSRLERLEAENKALLADAADRSYRSGITSVIETLKGDLDVDDLVVEAWANKQAADDQRLQRLWEQRDTHKREFSEAIQALKPEFQKYAQEKILASAKGDKGNKGLVAAVRNARDDDSADAGMDDVDWGGLSDREFALKKSEVFRLAKAGKLK